MANRKNARLVEVRRAPVKPSETQYVRLPEEQPAELFEYPDEPGAPQYQDAALQGVLAELGERDEDAKVTVKRVSVNQGVRRMEWLFECHPSEFSVPNIQDWYGAGEYQCIVYGKQDGSNYKIVHANKKLLIGDPIGGPKIPAAPALAGAPPQSALDVQRAVSEAVAGPLTALANTIAQMMPKPSSRADTFAELKQMGELFAMMRGTQAPPPDPLAMLAQAVAFVKSAAPAPAPALPLTDDGDLSPNFVLSKGIDLVQAFMQAHRGAVPPGAPGAPGLPAPGAPPPGAGSPAITTTEAEAVKIALKMQLGMLLHAARMDSEPETYSVLIYEQAPDEVVSTLRAETWFADLCKLEPGFTAFKPWAEKVRAQILEMIAEDAAPEGEGKAAPLTPGVEPGKSGDDGSTSPGLERVPAD